MEFTKEQVKALSAEIKEALEVVAERHGVTVKVGGGRYDPAVGTFIPKVEFAAGDSARRNWDRWAQSFGLKAEDFGRSFRSGGMLYEIVGLNVKATKRPIIVQGQGMKQYVFPADAVQRALGVTPAVGTLTEVDFEDVKA